MVFPFAPLLMFSARGRRASPVRSALPSRRNVLMRTAVLVRSACARRLGGILIACRLTIGMTRSVARTSCLLALTLALAAAVTFELGAADDGDHALLPEAERAFLDDGPGWLVPDADRKALLAMDSAARAAWIKEFLARDPVASTSDNELVEGIERRRQLVSSEVQTFLDDRARMLFLQGQADRARADPLRSDLQAARDLVVRPARDDSGLRALPAATGESVPAVAAARLQARALRQRDGVVARRGGRDHRRQGWQLRFDKRLCKQAEVVDRATGVDGLFGYHENRPTNDLIRSILAPPKDLGAWAAAAYVTSLPDAPATLQLAGPPEVYFPEAKSQRMVSRLLLRIPEDAGLEVFREDEKAEVRLKIDGVVEHEGELFEEFHMRYQVPITGEEPPPLILLADRLLRPGEPFLVRFKIHDEIGGAEARANLGFRVPMTAQAAADLPADVVVTQGVDVEPERVPGVDSLVIVPPETDVVLGLWRVETLISGERISKVVFLVDGKPQYTKTAGSVPGRGAARQVPHRAGGAGRGLRLDRPAGRVRRGGPQPAARPARGAHHRAQARRAHYRQRARQGVDRRPRGAQARARRVPGRRQGDRDPGQAAVGSGPSGAEDRRRRTTCTTSPSPPISTTARAPRTSSSSTTPTTWRRSTSTWSSSTPRSRARRRQSSPRKSSRCSRTAGRSRS